MHKIICFKTNKMNGDWMRLKEKLEIYNLLIGLAAKVAIAIGAVILLGYCLTIDYFPRELSIGDGLLFTFVAAGFGLIYFIFIACLTCLGICIVELFKLIRNAFKRLKHRVTNKGFKTQWSEKLPIAFLCGYLASQGVLIIIVFGLTSLGSLVALVSTVILCTVLWKVVLVDTKKIKNHKVLTHNEQEAVEAIAKLKRERKIKILLITIAPLIMCGYTEVLTKTSMTILNIRNESVTVNVKDPYAKAFIASGIKANKSELGDEFKRFDDTKILLSGFGGKVLFSKSVDCEHETHISVPSDSFIITYPEAVDRSITEKCIEKMKSQSSLKTQIEGFWDKFFE